MSTWKNLSYTQPTQKPFDHADPVVEPAVEADYNPEPVPVDQAAVDTILALSPEIV